MFKYVFVMVLMFARGSAPVHAGCGNIIAQGTVTSVTWISTKVDKNGAVINTYRVNFVYSYNGGQYVDNKITTASHTVGGYIEKVIQLRCVRGRKG